MKKSIVVFFMVFILFTWLAKEGDASLKPEFRGVWVDVRSIPSTQKGIQDLLDRLQHAHFNAVLVETFYQGETIYPSPILASQGLSPQMATFRQAVVDPLQMFIEEAHRRSMQVHAWLDMFYVGLNTPGPILTKYPQWRAINKDGTFGYIQGTNHFFWACPMHPGIADFYRSLVREVIYAYDVDGILFDYLRFPDPTLADTCYAPEHRDSFRASHGVDPAELDPLKDPETFRAWNRLRAEAVTNLLSLLSQEAHHLKPGIIVSCAVIPRGMPIELNPGFLQDWPQWAEKRLIDVLVPMTYSSRANEMKGLLVWVKNFLQDNLPVYAGLQGFQTKDPLDLSRQVEIARESGSAGEALFAYPHLNETILKNLLSGPFQDSVLAPNRSFLQEKIAQHTSRPISYRAPHPRMIPALFTSHPVQIDGILDDPTWSAAEWQNDFTLITGEGKATKQTKIALCYDQTNLYIAFSILDSPQSQTQATIVDRDGPVFYDDSVELFLDPGLTRSFYHHFAVNALGTLYDSSSIRGASWNGNWKAATARNGDTWTVELSLPFSDVSSRPPQEGERWGINFNRTALTNEEFSGWAFTPGTFLAPSFFGIVEFNLGNAVRSE